MTVPRHSHNTRSALHDWRVATESPGDSGGSVRRYATPFVGREALLHQLLQIVAQARDGDRLVVSLSGEAGIGKSRLLREIAQRGAASGLDVLWAGDPSAALPPPGPGRELLRAEHVDPEAGPCVVVPPGLPGIGDGRPLLVMIDASSPIDRLPDAAGLMAGSGDRTPVVTFLTLPSGARAGPDGRAARELLATLARWRVLVEVAVPPLADAELFELTSHLLGGPPNARLHEAISSLSEGNPFLAEELTVDLVQRGLVAGERGAWYLLGSVPTGYVPDSVVTVLGFDLEALDPNVLQTLSYAAVLGTGFRFDVLAAALACPTDSLLLHLEAGLVHGILREAADPPDDFQFTHELVRRVLYRRLSGIRRRHLHQAVAEALERQASRSDASDPNATLAFHFTRGVDRERALDYLLRAQERAEHVQAWDDAIRYCREGLDLARQAEATDVELELDLLERLAALYFGQVQTFATGACWREALHVCEQANSASLSLRRAALAARLAALGPSWYSIEAAEAILEQALRFAGADELDQAPWRFDAFHELGLAHQRIGQLADAIRYLGLACAAVDPTDWPRRALALVSLGGVLNTAGRPTEAADRAREAIAILEAGAPEGLVRRHQINHLRDPRRIRCRALGELGRSLTSLGQLDQASRLIEQVRDEEQQFGTLDSRAQRLAAQIELARARPERALQILSAKMRQPAAGTLTSVRTADLLVLAQAQLMHGEADLALDTADEGIRLCHRSSAREHLAGLHVVTAGAHLARRAVTLACASVVQAWDAIEQTGAEAYRAGALEVEARCRAALATAPSSAPEPPAPRPTSRLLTARECEVLALMAEGRTNRQIADALVLSDKTVKRHLSNIFDKLGVSSRAAAVHSAYRAGLL